jgi:hypothetical protein
MSKSKLPTSEAKWLSCRDGLLMLDFLLGHGLADALSVMRDFHNLGAKDQQKLHEITEFHAGLRRLASERKLRLFALACCQRIETLLSTTLEMKALGVIEAVADGRLPPVERTKVLRALTHTINREWGSLLADDPASYPCLAVCFAARRLRTTSSWWAAKYAALAVANNSARARRTTRADRDVREKKEYAAQALLLRDIFGNPFRPVAITSSWHSWNGGTIAKLAQTIYDDRAFDRLPILADALEDAGCTNQDILGALPWRWRACARLLGCY